VVRVGSGRGKGRRENGRARSRSKTARELPPKGAVEGGFESGEVEEFDPGIERGTVPGSNAAVLVADDEDSSVPLRA
jgi:hypothetical protein